MVLALPGYDAELGPPDDSKPVQEQYTGSREMCRAQRGNPAVGELLADSVMDFYRPTRPAERLAPLWPGATLPSFARGQPAPQRRMLRLDEEIS